MAYDEQAGEQGYKPVKQIFRNTTKEWYHVRVHGEEIVCTGGHPFYVVGVEFMEARNLKTSDKLLLSNGEYAIIEAIQVEQLETPETTYNFEVTDFHTYYVGENSILVHNMCRRRNPDLDFKSGKTLEKHYNDHGRKMGFKDSDDYLQGARDFFDGLKSSSTQSFTSAQGTYFQYNPVTNEFGIINQYGGISTYFEPDTGNLYWLEQIAKYKL